MKLGQNFVKYFVRFLGNGELRKNAFEIYQPLVKTTVNTKHIVEMSMFFQLILIFFATVIVTVVENSFNVNE